MKLTKEQEAEVIPIYNEWWHSYLNGDVKTYEHYLDDDYRFVGSTVAEDFLNKRDTTQFFDETADQLAGKTQKRNSKLTTEYYDGVVFITELADAYLLFGNEWTFYGKFRFSSMLRKRSDGWRFIYQHFSVPDSKTQEGETIGFEQVSKENQELRDAIKRRTAELENKNRELEIESALERVRSASMAMQESEELASVARTVFEQLRVLGIDVYRSWIDIFHVDQGYILTWSTDFEGNFQPNPATFPLHFDETMSDFYRDYKSSSEFIELEAHGDGVKEWFDYLYSVSSDPIFKMPNVPDDLYQIWAKHKYGTVATTKLSPITNDEKDILNRFANVFEQAYTRFLDLQKAEAQAREAQIEMALEKVRSRTMAMQSSDELTEAASEMFSQIEGLGLNPWSCGFNIFNDDKTVISQWVSSGDGRPIEPFDTPANEFIFKRVTEQSKNSEPLYIEKMEGKKLEDTYKYMASLPTLDKIFEELDAAGIELPKKQVNHAAYFKQGYLMFITYDERPEFHSIFKRFAKVFEQTYTRFLDLQKAEAQAREAQIEMALEKVRSRTMAMQNSDELIETSELMFEQIKNLDIELWSCGFSLWYDDDSYFIGYNPGPEGKMGKPLRIPLTEDVFFTTIREAKRRGEEFLVFESEGKSLEQTYNYMDGLPMVGETMRGFVEAGYPLPTYQVTHCGFFSEGHLMFITQEPNPEAIDIFKRFTKVFEQTYTRFLDLQKAEEQAREAKIEMSLEKIRSRTMGMQSSDELPEVANMLFLEVQELGIPAWSCGYCILTEDRRSSTCIMSSEGTIQKPFLLPHLGEPSFEEWDDFVHGDQTFFTQELKEEAIDSHYNFMKSLPQLKPIFQDLVDAGLSLPAYQINHLCKFSHGFLLFITYEEVPGSHDIFKRFTSVFEQTYTRFLDLKKSEKRAREAEVDLSLERVRSQVTAMQTSSDLFDIVVNMRKEFISLGHTADYFWHMRWLPDVYEMSMTSEDGNRLGMVINVPKFVHDQIPGLAEWEKGSDPMFVLALNAEDAWDYIDNMNEHGDYEVVDPNAPTKKDIEHIGGLTFIIARTSHGEIGYSLPGMVPNPPKDAIDTLVRLAGVFDLAYKRFEDLQESEQQARLILEERDRLEAALKELHATQDQLVQQEKLASLGQLTAGIAHEIKNPLNFVNNFSDVSVELIGEAKEELSAISGQLSAEDREKVVEALEILNSIDMNLRKIHEHGSRADSIVKSMLEHSRGGSGKMEPTDLNALVKEFANLSFHGMRASKDPINVEIEFDLDESIEKVPLIAEDFSRVILNLCNNGFEAMRDKLEETLQGFETLGGLNGYRPKLTVRTHQNGSNLTIEIEDNGPGIPKEFKDKILQPFFTTKKGTQGTGLGLSITNDIVKAHGGTMDVKSSAGKSTTFTIHLDKKGQNGF